LPQARFGVPEFHNYAADEAQQMGKAMSNFGGHMTEIATDAQNEANKTVAKDIDTQVTAAIGEVLYNPEKGYLTKQGKDVVAGYGDAIKDLNQVRQKAVDGIQNPAVRQMVEPVINARMQNALETINRHSATETRRYQAQTSDSRAVVTLQDAAFNYDDDKRFNEALAVTREETANLAKLQGWDESTARLQAQKYADTGYRMRYEAWAIKDPVSAFAHFQQNAEQISPLVRDNIGRQLFQHAAPVLATYLNQNGGAGVVPPEPGEVTAPRGIRNNNPGNIMRGSGNWQGEVQGNDPRYSSFGTPEAGIRAMGKILINYQDKHGINTVEGVISRWAPATENNTAAYVATVAKEMGVKPDAALDLHDQATLGKLTRAIIRVENGKQPYTDDQIALGLAAATGDAPLPPAAAGAKRDPNVITGIGLIDGLPADWKLHVLQLARAEAHQDMAEARESLRSRVQDATAEFMANGFASNPPNEAEFIRAYGQAEGASRYREFQDVATLGQTLQQVKTLPTAALNDMVKTSKPAPGDGFAARQHNYEILTHAVNTVLTARAEDPVAYALTNGSYGIKPLQRFEDPQALGQELARRAAAAPQMSADYGTPPRLLSNAEAKALAATLKAMPVDVQKVQLASMYKGVNDMGLFKQTMQAIAPDMPTLAVAGIYQARGLRTTENRDVADLILRGQSILTPNKKEDGSGHMGGAALIKMPEEKLLLSDWTSVTGDAFKGKEQAADLFMQTAKAIYAARSAEEGDYSGMIDSKRWKAAINMATGGIESHNGSKIVLPYGMGYDNFQNALRAQVDRIVQDGGALNTTAREMMRLPLENVGDGRYLFRRGTGYLVGKDGRPVVADLSRGR
jgi:hypothetical protein